MFGKFRKSRLEMKKLNEIMQKRTKGLSEIEERMAYYTQRNRMVTMKALKRAKITDLKQRKKIIELEEKITTRMVSLIKGGKMKSFIGENLAFANDPTLKTLVRSVRKELGPKKESKFMFWQSIYEPFLAARIKPKNNKAEE